MTFPPFLIPLMAFIGGIVAGSAIRRLLRWMPAVATAKSHRNIGLSDRLLRFTIAVGLFIWAALSDWSPLLLFFAGFTLYEALQKWCALYAAIGKNTCPR